jgi:hypothetical protein
VLANCVKDAACWLGLKRGEPIQRVKARDAAGWHPNVSRALKTKNSLQKLQTERKPTGVGLLARCAVRSC